MRKILGVIAGAMLLITAGTPAFAADATKPTAASNEADLIAEIDQELRKFAVPADKRPELIEDYLAGRPWDSMSEGVEPVAVEQRHIDGFAYTVRTYPDGSFHASGVEVPREADSQPGNVPAAITGCSFYSSGGTSYFSNCTVRQTVGVITGDFRADYRMNSGANTASITYAGAPGVYIVGGSASGTQIVMVRQSYAPGIPARAELRFTGTLPGEWAGVSLWLQLHVIPTGAISLSNFDVV